MPKRILFAVASLLLFFLLLELLLAALGVAPLSSERDPLAGFSSKVRIFELDPEAGVYRTRRQAVTHSFHPQRFAAEKADGAYRVFVIGGSSAFGFPWGAEVAFPHALGLALEESFRPREVEVINAAAMSYGSHRLLLLARELLDYAPDAIVVYGGHNEFIERRFYRDLLERNPDLDSARLLLDRSRLFSALTRAYRAGAAPSAAGETTGELLGLDVVREDSTDVGAAEVEEVRSTLEENLRAIVEEAGRRGVDVLLCTVPSNLRDWRPNQSFFDPSVEGEARRRVLRLLEGRATGVEGLEEARDLAPGFAETHFRLGRAYETEGRWKEADAAYRAARDLDAQPSRAPGALNETIRAVAAETSAELVDVEQLFSEQAEHGLLGFNLFEDYVHPKPSGHRAIARALWRRLAGRDGTDLSIFERATGHLAIDSGDENAPAAASGAATPRQLFNLAFVLENQGLYDEAIEKYRAVLALEPRHHGARFSLARLLAEAGRFREAEAQYRVALETGKDDPLQATMLLGLGDAVRGQGRVEESISLYRSAVEIDERVAGGWGRIGSALAQAGRTDEAGPALRRALELDPGDLAARTQLGMLHLVLGRFDEAGVEFRRVIEQKPAHLSARTGLAATLVEAGRLDEAEGLFREVLLDAPGDSRARAGLEIIARRRAAGSSGR